jgi:catechol 2,3-dioxygenase-like lactoylglutathione lyase family enzyme
MGLVSLSTMFCVSDVERSAAWYRDKLGFEILKQEPEIALLRRDSGLVYLFAARRPVA